LYFQASSFVVAMLLLTGMFVWSYRSKLFLSRDKITLVDSAPLLIGAINAATSAQVQVPCRRRDGPNGF
jgi:hypothetical protein